MTSLSHDAIRSAVRRGALLLDERKPGWASLVNLDTLNMHHGDRCIGAQVFGAHYATAMRLLGLDISSGVPPHYGFNLAAPHPRWGAPEYGWLREAWVAEIAERRKPVKPARVRKPRVRKPVHTLSAQVSTTYAPGQNVSVTRRGDVIVKVTTWTTGIPNSTRRH